MSYPNRFNKFGKLKWKYKYSNAAILVVGRIYEVAITDTEKDEYGPFPRVVIINDSPNDVIVYIDGYDDGNYAVNNAEHQFTLPADSTLFIDYDDAVLISNSIIVKNIGINNISIGDIKVFVQNYEKTGGLSW